MDISIAEWKISENNPKVITTGTNAGFTVGDNCASPEFILSAYKDSIDTLTKQYNDKILELERENLELRNKTINIKTNLKSAHSTLERLLTNY